MDNTTLSPEAADLLRRRLADERVEVTDENRPIYRELARAGLMIPLHTFFGGGESAYRLTEAAFNGSILASRIPSPEGSPVRGG